MKILLGVVVLAAALAAALEPRRRERKRVADTWAAATDRL